MSTDVDDQTVILIFCIFEDLQDFDSVAPHEFFEILKKFVNLRLQMRQFSLSEVPRLPKRTVEIRQVSIILEKMSDLYSCILAKFWKSLANFENFWNFARCKSAKSCRSRKMEKKYWFHFQNRAIRNADCGEQCLRMVWSQNRVVRISTLRASLKECRAVRNNL